jgi:iron complex outermembrane receptor protein
MTNQQTPPAKGGANIETKTAAQAALWLGVSALALAAAAGPAMAADQPTAVATAASSAATAAAADTSTGVEEVQVVARRRQENTQDVPIAITALSGKSLARDNTDVILKLAEKVPSITIFATNPKQVLVGLRGIGANAGNNDGLEPSVGLFIDGVYLGRTGQLGFSGNFEDLQDLQVLRGPQGTLFGKNTTAGAILINSNPPSFTPFASTELDLGNYNLRQFHGVISGPIIADKLALRLSVYDNQRDGTFYNQTQGNRLNGLNNSGFRAQALFTPTPDLSVRLIASRDTISQAQVPSVYLGDGPTRPGSKSYSQRLTAIGYTPVDDPYSYTVQNDARLFAQASADAYSGEVNWKVGGYKLTSLTAYRDYNFYPYNDFDYTPLPIELQGGTTNNLKQYSQEFRIASPTDEAIFGQHIDWVAGAYFYQQSLEGVNRAIWGPDEYYIATPPAGTTPASFNGVNYGYNALGQVRSSGLFGQANWHITDRLELTGGLRETWERKSAYTNQYLTNAGGLTPAQVASVFGVTFGTSSGAVNSANLSWLASLSYKVTPQVLVYGSVARGQKSAAANIGVFTAVQVAAGAATIIPGEEANSYEIGVKSELFDRTLQLNLAGFDTTVTNYQTTIQALDTADPNNVKSVSFLGSVPGLRTEGFELEATYVPPFVDRLELTSNVSYNHAVYTSFPNAPCPAEVSALLPSTAVCLYNMSGKRVEQIPEWQADLSADYSHRINSNLEGYVLARYSWKSDNYLAASDSIYGHVPAYAVTNLRIGLRIGDHYDVSIWANNLTDTHYLINTVTATVGGAVRGSPGDPRTVGVSLRARL